MPDERFAKNVDELIESTLSFFDQPEYWREAVGSSPKYFTHYLDNGLHYFGLSKYCAFRNVQVRQYVSRLRNTTNGNITQKHISKLAGVSWVPFSRSKPEIRRAFSEWIHGFFPAYRLTNASFITLATNAQTLSRRDKKPSAISPDHLQKKLQRQTVIGKVGELIALRYEIARLQKLGIANPKECVDHVSKRNSAAGFDIWSRASKTTVRFIEVKSSTTDSDSFFITKNEVDTLRDHGSDAYLYFVLVKDIDKEDGEVVLELRNPIKVLESSSLLDPILYRAELKKDKIVS